MPLLGPPPQPAPPAVEIACALLLAAAAGFVDAFGYLVLARVFTAHMSGNSASLGLYAALRDPRQALWHGWPVLWFVVGLLAGATITETGRRRFWHARLSLVLAIEVLLLGLLWALAVPAPAGALRFALVALPAAAMGMQTVTVTRFHNLRFYTTYVTGNMAKFAEAAVQWAMGRGERPAADAARPRDEALQHLLLTAALWIVFLLGAYAGALARLAAGDAALAWPIGALGLVVVVDAWRPLAPVGENERAGLHL